MRGVIVAKFIPGLSILAPPLAGSSGVRASRFFFFDGLGSLLYAGCFILLGNQLEQVIAAQRVRLACHSKHFLIAVRLQIIFEALLWGKFMRCFCKSRFGRGTHLPNAIVSALFR